MIAGRDAVARQFASELNRTKKGFKDAGVEDELEITMGLYLKHIRTVTNTLEFSRRLERQIQPEKIDFFIYYVVSCGMRGLISWQILKDCCEKEAVRLEQAVMVESLLNWAEQVYHSSGVDIPVSKDEFSQRLSRLRLNANGVSHAKTAISRASEIPEEQIRLVADALMFREYTQPEAEKAPDLPPLIFLLGREKVLEDIWNMLFQSTNDSPCIVWLGGPGGRGKTAVARRIYEDVGNPPVIYQDDIKTYKRVWIGAKSFSRKNGATPSRDLHRTVEAIINNLASRVGGVDLASDIITKVEKLTAIFRSMRFFVVLDNLEVIQNLSRLMNYIRDFGGNGKSRFLLTGRPIDELSEDDFSMISRYPIVKLSKQVGIDLLVAKLKGIGLSNELNNLRGNSIPQSFEQPVDYIAWASALCDGVPLFLVHAAVSLSVHIADPEEAIRELELGKSDEFKSVYLERWKDFDEYAKKLLYHSALREKVSEKELQTFASSWSDERYKLAFRQIRDAEFLEGHGSGWYSVHSTLRLFINNQGFGNNEKEDS